MHLGFAIWQLSMICIPFDSLKLPLFSMLVSYLNSFANLCLILFLFILILKDF